MVAKLSTTINKFQSLPNSSNNGGMSGDATGLEGIAIGQGIGDRAALEKEIEELWGTK